MCIPMLALHGIFPPLIIPSGVQMADDEGYRVGQAFFGLRMKGYACGAHDDNTSLMWCGGMALVHSFPLVVWLG